MDYLWPSSIRNRLLSRPVSGNNSLPAAESGGSGGGGGGAGDVNMSDEEEAESTMPLANSRTSGRSLGSARQGAQSRGDVAGPSTRTSRQFPLASARRALINDDDEDSDDDDDDDSDYDPRARGVLGRIRRNWRADPDDPDEEEEEDAAPLLARRGVGAERGDNLRAHRAPSSSSTLAENGSESDLMQMRERRNVRFGNLDRDEVDDNRRNHARDRLEALAARARDRIAAETAPSGPARRPSIVDLTGDSDDENVAPAAGPANIADDDDDDVVFTGAAGPSAHADRANDIGGRAAAGEARTAAGRRSRFAIPERHLAEFNRIMEEHRASEARRQAERDADMAALLADEEAAANLPARRVGINLGGAVFRRRGDAAAVRVVPELRTYRGFDLGIAADHALRIFGLRGHDRDAPAPAPVDPQAIIATIPLNPHPEPQPGFSTDFDMESKQPISLDDDGQVIASKAKPPRLCCLVCLRRLALASSCKDEGDRVWTMRCGHLLHHRCLMELCTPSQAEADKLLPQGLEVLGEEEGTGKRKRKRSTPKKVPPVKPIMWTWKCPVTACGKEHVSVRKTVAGQWTQRAGMGALPVFM